MQISFIGLGRLGLPTAVAIVEKGHTVYGYEINQDIVENYKRGVSNLYEPEMDARLKAALSNMRFVESIEEAVLPAEIVFVVVQTPHPPELDGSIRFHHVRKDFNYEYLVKAAQEVALALNRTTDYKVVSIISTVLPGTTRNIVYPAMKEVTKNLNWGLCYNPLFIAMGQTISDFGNPEFTLIGEQLSGTKSGEMLAQFYNTIQDSPKLRMTWDEAEMVKMCYNTFIGFKIIFSNMIMELCHKTPNANCDVVMDAFCQATDRLISKRYLKGGMGDGGACHPRDNLALSFLSDKLGLGYNVFDFVMTVREKQTEWLVDLMCQYKLPKVILGKSFKPDTNLIVGSPSILLANILKERGEKVTFYDPVTDPSLPPEIPSVYLIGTRWKEFKDFNFVPGSVVIDPWGFIDTVPPGIKLISVGRNQ